MFKINFVPSHTDDLNYLWEIVSARNNWFIKLRYAASAMLLAFWMYIFSFSGVEYHDVQLYLVFFLSLFILAYNLLFEYINKEGVIKNNVTSFNPLKFAFLQIVLDLISLLFLVYITGNIESPFYLFFIFHAIIGSMVLANSLVYGLFILLLVIFSLLTFLGYYEIIPVMYLHASSEQTLGKIILSLVVFWILTMLSVMFANNLASALFKREQQLIAAEKEKQRYVNTVIHEVKSPVAGISSYVDILLNDYVEKLGDKTKDYLLKVSKKSESAINLINEIIDISSVELSASEQFEKIDLQKVLKDVIDNYAGKIKSSYLDVKVISLSNSNYHIEGNERLIALCFSNLIGNAIKYSTVNGKVICKLINTTDEITVEIEDNGIGIPAEDTEKLFEEFHRGKNAKSSGIEGTGLGLSLTKKILLKHEAEIKIVSPSSIGTPDMPGTKVTVTFETMVE